MIYPIHGCKDSKEWALSSLYLRIWYTLQRTATHCDTLQHTVTHGNSKESALSSLYLWILDIVFTNFRHTATHCNALQHTAARCITLQEFAQLVAAEARSHVAAALSADIPTHTHTHTSIHTNIHRHIHILSNGSSMLNLQYTKIVELILATQCNTLQHTATHCNAQRFERVGSIAIVFTDLRYTATHCNTLQHTATHLEKLCSRGNADVALQVHIQKNSRSLLNSPYTCLSTHCNTLQHTATHCNTLQHTATHCTTLHHIAPHCITHPKR